MAENVPVGAGAPPANSTADQPGRPYYESLRGTLRQTLEKKRKLDEQLAALEEQIFKLEGAYLEETATSGNIVRGFDGWVKGVTIGAGDRGGRSAADDRRRGRVRDEDRVFSRSSVSWMRVCVLLLRFCVGGSDAGMLMWNCSYRHKKGPTRARLRMRRRRRPRLHHSSHTGSRARPHRRARLSRARTRRSEQRRRTMAMAGKR